jgi:glycosyltransferase involved in cell wall biosynthesis
MWQMALPSWLARLGTLVESKVAPPLYHDTRIVTLSKSSRDEIVGMLGLDPDQITVAVPGVEPRFSPGGKRDDTPLVVAVGRLVPVKRFEVLIDALVQAKARCPELRAAIVGEGYERSALEERIASQDAMDWIELPGYVDDDTLVEWYRRAWLVASSSQREGWGMTLTEAGACGTPAVATDIAGHRDAIVDGRTGLLADGVNGLADAMATIIGDAELRARLERGALERSRWFTWEATARCTLEALAEEATSRP